MAQVPPEAEIRRLLAERIQALALPAGVGIVVGVAEPGGRKVVASDPSLNGQTVFEIGSVTKGFTALLLADGVRRGEVRLTDPVARHLPAGVRLPERNGHPITLLDLATHTAGLPFMPPPASEPYRFLAGFPSSRGSDWDYSNLGYWLLSEALAHRTGTGYQSLLRSRILEPLGLTSTGFAPTPAMQARRARGHDASLRPAPDLAALPDYAWMPAAGGLVSTVDDLLTLLSVALDSGHSPLADDLALTLRSRRPAGKAGEKQALGWSVLDTGKAPLVFRDGGTLGYASCLAWDPAHRAGVVVLSNQITGVRDLALHLLRRELPLDKPAAAQPTEIALDPAQLDRLAGRYEAPGEGIFLVAREAGFLTFEAPADWGLPKLRLRPESPRDFFAAELPLRVAFEISETGTVSGIRISPPRGQKTIPARREAGF